MLNFEISNFELLKPSLVGQGLAAAQGLAPAQTRLVRHLKYILMEASAQSPKTLKNPPYCNHIQKCPEY